MNKPPAGRTPGLEVPAAAGIAAGPDDVKVAVTGTSEQSFPRISVQFEVKRPDGSFLLDAGRDDFRVTEEGRPVDVVDFRAPLTTEAIPTTVVLVVDRSLSMEEENRIGGLKKAVHSFLEKLPDGSRVAVIAFGSEVDRLCTFTTDRGQIKTAVDALEPAGATRFYDAVAEALEMLDHEPGRRAVLALTDGEDTFSQSASLESVDRDREPDRAPGFYVGTGLQGGDRGARTFVVWRSRRAGSITRPVMPISSARSYEQIAERLTASYTLIYQTDRKIPDGTLRPSALIYRAMTRSAGETAVFIPGMVVPSPGWSRLFLFLLLTLGVLFALPSLLTRRKVQA